MKKFHPLIHIPLLSGIIFINAISICLAAPSRDMPNGDITTQNSFSQNVSSSTQTILSQPTTSQSTNNVVPNQPLNQPSSQAEQSNLESGRLFDVFLFIILVTFIVVFGFIIFKLYQKIKEIENKNNSTAPTTLAQKLQQQNDPLILDKLEKRIELIENQLKEVETLLKNNDSRINHQHDLIEEIRQEISEIQDKLKLLGVSSHTLRPDLAQQSTSLDSPVDDHLDDWMHSQKNRDLEPKTDDFTHEEDSDFGNSPKPKVVKSLFFSGVDKKANAFNMADGRSQPNQDTLIKVDELSDGSWTFEFFEMAEHMLKAIHHQDHLLKPCFTIECVTSNNASVVENVEPGYLTRNGDQLIIEQKASLRLL